jgi:hypothetical protein
VRASACRRSGAPSLWRRTGESPPSSSTRYALRLTD